MAALKLSILIQNLTKLNEALGEKQKWAHYVCPVIK
jgi:hypothetical protein